MKVKIVRISEIKVGERNRQFSSSKAVELSKSIEEIGLLHPVIINRDNTLIAGLHRLEAAKLLGWSEIPCNVFDIDTDNAEEQAEIHENLIRVELTELEKADLLCRAKEIHEIRHPESNKANITKRNLKQFAGKEIISLSGIPSQKSFANSIAENIGLSPRSVRQSIQIARGIAPEVKEIIKNKPLADSKTDLITLSKLKPDMQEAVCSIISEGGIRKVKEAIYQVRKETLNRSFEKAEIAATVQTDINKSDNSDIEVSAGDIFQLGDSILICGDNTSLEVIDYLKPYHFSFCFADPPYGAGIADYDLKPFTWNQDYLTDLADIVAVTPGVMSIKSFMRATSMNYRWSFACYVINGHGGCPTGYRHWYYIAIFSNLKNIFKGAKDHFSITLPPIPLGDKQITAQRQKPAGLLTYLIEVFSSQDNFVLDPFAGSGATLLICEALNRKCVTIEILPEMVEAIIRRFVDKFPDLIIKKIGNLIDREESNAFR
jgi:16S rRNA G966 N2-methylase RsmD